MRRKGGERRDARADTGALVGRTSRLDRPPRPGWARRTLPGLPTRPPHRPRATEKRGRGDRRVLHGDGACLQQPRRQPLSQVEVRQLIGQLRARPLLPTRQLAARLSGPGTVSGSRNGILPTLLSWKRATNVACIRACSPGISLGTRPRPAAAPREPLAAPLPQFRQPLAQRKFVPSAAPRATPPVDRIHHVTDADMAAHRRRLIAPIAACPRRDDRGGCRARLRDCALPVFLAEFGSGRAGDTDVGAAFLCARPPVSIGVRRSISWRVRFRVSRCR
jgi:hypothetical protein